MLLCKRLLSCLALVGLVLALGTLAAEAQDKKKDEKEGKKGKTVGMLTAKGENFIEVRADGEEKGRKYVPRWLGGAPAQGGGPDKAVLKVFRGLKIGSRIEVEWVFEERLRALKVQVLQAPEKK